jgi:cellulase (glycosyl hydrolase family 5)
MMRRLTAAVLLTAVLPVLTGQAAGARATMPTGAGVPGAAAAAAPSVTVSGAHLMRNGKAWLPKGLSMIGSLTCGVALDASTHWGSAELTAGRSFGADLMRFQASQPFLDPQSTQYQAGYLDRIKSMVAAAESNGFVVVLSMQDQSLACGDATVLPTSETRRAWKRLAAPFLTDPGVLLELYNEPDNPATAAGWTQWKSGGGGFVGHQQLVDDLRSMGARNVLLADGAKKSETLAGVKMLSDPLKSIAYAVHPYNMASINTDPTSWDKRWGFLTAKAPVIVSEWNSQSMRAGCRTDDPVLAARLVPWLKDHGIGLVGWSFDLPNTLVKDWTWAPTSYSGYTCGVPGGGAGALLRSSFTS